MNKILIVAAHPDDEILGCGGTIARLIKEGFIAYTLILSEGITSRDRSKKRIDNEIKKLKNQAFIANEIIGVKRVFIFNFPDNKFDTVPFLDIVKVVEKIKQKIKPDIIFTHYSEDLNIDHQIAFGAVMTATRPISEESVREIYSFEVPSSTEWNYISCFCPNVYFDVTSTLEIKLKALNQYKLEMKSYPHPRSIKGIKLTAEYRGMCVGLKYVEGFKMIRTIK